VGRLYVDFCGEQHVVDPGHELRFGREAELAIDTNPYLHRVLGRFVHRDGHWWLDNLGSAIPLQLFDRSGPTTAVVAPGSAVVVTFGEFRCGFTAGRQRYELDGALEDFELELELGEVLNGLRTLEWGVVDLNHDQRLLLTALCADRLSGAVDREGDPPANRACARRLGWSLSKFNRKLDHLCLKLSKVGVDGLHGEDGLQATNRRRRLVDHALEVELVTPDDLALLDPA
jgi:hypothetical protein